VSKRVRRRDDNERERERGRDKGPNRCCEKSVARRRCQTQQQPRATWVCIVRARCAAAYDPRTGMCTGGSGSSPPSTSFILPLPPPLLPPMPLPCASATAWLPAGHFRISSGTCLCVIESTLRCTRSDSQSSRKAGSSCGHGNRGGWWRSFSHQSAIESHACAVFLSTWYLENIQCAPRSPVGPSLPLDPFPAWPAATAFFFSSSISYLALTPTGSVELISSMEDI